MLSLGKIRFLLKLIYQSAKKILVLPTFLGAKIRYMNAPFREFASSDFVIPEAN